MPFRVVTHDNPLDLHCIHQLLIVSRNNPGGYESNLHRRQNVMYLEQWSSTWGTRIAGCTRIPLTGYVKLKKKIFCDKHRIIGARFRVSHRRPGHMGIRFQSATFLSYNFALLKCIWSFINFVWYYLIHSGLENRDYRRRGSAALTMLHTSIHKSWH
jgi:hypothetical protein